MRSVIVYIIWSCSCHVVVTNRWKLAQVTGIGGNYAYRNVHENRIYIEATRGSNSKPTQLHTNPFKTSYNGTNCSITFDYYINSKLGAYLNVYACAVQGHERKQVFHVGHHHSTRWREVDINLTGGQPDDVYLLFEGAVGNSMNGVIAIDNVVFSSACLIDDSRIFPATNQCMPNEYYCQSNSTCITANEISCSDRLNCGDNSKKGNCTILTTKKSHNRTALHAGIILGILLIIITLASIYLWFQRREKVDVLSSMARHRGMSVRQESIASSGDKPAIDEKRGSTRDDPVVITTDQTLSNPSYEDGEFTTIDLDVDMFDDGETLPDFTIRRSSLGAIHR